VVIGSADSAVFQLQEGKKATFPMLYRDNKCAAELVQMHNP